MSDKQNLERRPPNHSYDAWHGLAALTGTLLPALVLAAEIIGTSGPDVMQGTRDDDLLNGLGGADRMSGRKGDDTYVVGSSGDLVIETSFDDGTDTVRSSVTHSLRIYVDNLTLIGSAAINGTGNDFSNVMTGNAAANVLRGLGGGDHLKGKGGDDRLFGGQGVNVLEGDTGHDKFEYDLAPNPFQYRDAILDFSPIDDKIVLYRSAFPALTTAGTLPAAAFRIGPSALDPSVRIIYNPVSGIIYYDADGSGPTPRAFFATLSGVPAVTNANFTVQ
jgi:Ca2+-binding RTX toxin-like protein